MTYSRHRKILFTNILFLLALCMVWNQGGEVRAEIFPVTPANIQENIDDLPADTPDAQKPDSLQAILNELDDDAEDEDALVFAAGEYENVGELLITKPVILRADGDVTFKGKILINVKSSNVQIQGFKFMNVTVPDTVTMGIADVIGHEDGTQPLVFGFPGKTVKEFLTDLGISDVPTPLVAGTHVRTGTSPYQWYHAFPVYDDSRYVTAAPAVSVANGGCSTDTETGCTADRQPQIANRFTGRKIFYTLANDGQSFTTGNIPDFSTDALSSATVKNMLGTIWVDSWSSAEGCPAATGTPPAIPALIKDVVIRNNMFDGTELTAVRAGAGLERYDILSSTDPVKIIRGVPPLPCKAELDIIGNTFKDIGSKGSFVKTMPGGTVDATDADGNTVADVGNLEPAILLRNVSRAEVTDNSITGGNADGISLQGTPEGAVINIKNNEIVDTPLSGIVISGSDAYDENSKTNIMVMGNRITGASPNGAYITVFMAGYQNAWSGALSYSGRRFNSYLSFVEWCRPNYGVRAFRPSLPAFALISETHRTIAGNIMPEVWRATRPEFNFGQSSSFFSNFDSDDTTGDGLKRTQAEMGNTAVIRIDADECINIARVKVVYQEGVSIVGNDLGYGADAESSGYSRYGIAVEHPSTSVTVTGNNIDYFQGGSILNGGKSISVKDNYLTRLPLLSVATGGGEYTDRSMVSPDPIEPTTEAPRVVGPREDFINPDEVAPTVTAAAVNEAGTMLTLTYSEDLDEDSTPSAGAFTVSKSSDEDFARSLPITVSNVRVDGRTVILTLASSPKIEAGDAVRVTYVMPSGAADKIQDMAENPAPSFATSPTVTNNVGGGDGGGGDTMMPATAAGGGGGGCALASAGSGGVDLGTLLPFMLAGLAFGRMRRKSGEPR